MPTKTAYYYYRIYDDNEQYNHIRSTLPEKKIRALLKRFEKGNQQYFNTEFVKFLKQHDKKAEIIEVTRISY